MIFTIIGKLFGVGCDSDLAVCSVGARYYKLSFCLGNLVVVEIGAVLCCYIKGICTLAYYLLFAGEGVVCAFAFYPAFFCLKRLITVL